MDTGPDDFRCGGSGGRTCSLVVSGGSVGPNVAVDGALLRADELGSERSVGLGFAEAEEAVVLRAVAGFCMDDAVLITLSAAFTWAVVVPLPRALAGVGRAADFEVAGFVWLPFAVACC
jgi:hypothetical protein